ncbi:MAG: FAD-dependent oxidoreductase, partial [Candidatus Omnitrophica bacterium]|nr:FAD-dependent oxidoreductase [Candidatus Omnitrophota bacterium]
LMRISHENTAKFKLKPPDFILGDKVVVIGSGNTALDCARTAVRYGKEVKMVFRKSVEELRVRKEERIFAEEEGVKFEPRVNPVEIKGDPNNFVSSIKCMRYDYADEDESGNWSLAQVPDSEFLMDADTVVIAIGHQPNATAGRLVSRLKVKRDGTIAVNSSNMTTLSGIFAAGNVVTNAGPVVEAIASGLKVADDIDQYLQQI